MTTPVPVDAYLPSPLWQLVLIGLAGIVVWHLIPRRQPNTRLVVQLIFFAVMNAVLIAGDITPFRAGPLGGQDATTLLVLSAKLLWWTHLAWALIGAVRIYLVLRGYPRQARLLQDIVGGQFTSAFCCPFLPLSSAFPSAPWSPHRVWSPSFWVWRCRTP